MRRLGVALASIFLVTACGSADPGAGADPSPCPTPTPVDTAALPARLPLERWGTIVAVQERAGFVGAEAVTDTVIVELYPDIVRTLGEKGYTLLGGDNEGFEAEISFTDPRDNYVNFILRQGPCEGLVRIRVLVEMSAKGAG